MLIGIFLIVTLTTAGVQSQDVLGKVQVDIINRSYKECSEATQVDKGILQNARNGVFTEDRALMAYYECMFRHEHLNFVDEAGQFNKDNVRVFLHLEGNKVIWDDIIHNCFRDISSGDVNLAIYQIVVCFTEKVGGRLNLDV